MPRTRACSQSSGGGPLETGESDALWRCLSLVWNNQTVSPARALHCTPIFRVRIRCMIVNGLQQTLDLKGNGCVDSISL